MYVLRRIAEDVELDAAPARLTRLTHDERHVVLNDRRLLDLIETQGRRHGSHIVLEAELFLLHDDGCEHLAVVRRIGIICPTAFLQALAVVRIAREARIELVDEAEGRHEFLLVVMRGHALSPRIVIFALKFLPACAEHDLPALVGRRNRVDEADAAVIDGRAIA